MKNETFEIGESVRHPIFGEGVVTACAGPRRLGFSPTKCLAGRILSVNEPRPLDWPSTPEMEGESGRVEVNFREFGANWLVTGYPRLQREPLSDYPRHLRKPGPGEPSQELRLAQVPEPDSAMEPNLTIKPMCCRHFWGDYKRIRPDLRQVTGKQVQKVAKTEISSRRTSRDIRKTFDPNVVRFREESSFVIGDV